MIIKTPRTIGEAFQNQISEGGEKLYFMLTEPDLSKKDDEIEYTKVEMFSLPINMLEELDQKYTLDSKFYRKGEMHSEHSYFPRLVRKAIALHPI